DLRSSVERTDGKGRQAIYNRSATDSTTPHCNAKPCAGEEKAAGAGTMASNRKSNAQSNRNSRKSGRVLTPGWTPEGQATALRPSRRQVGCDGSAWHPRDARGNRDRGESHDSAPPTPPDIRVRIRRFGGLSEHLFPQEGWPPGF